jgi:hypothetical protein
VAVSALVLVAAAGTLAAWWALSRETRTTTYRVLGDVSALRLDLGAADVEIAGGATAIEIRRVDRFAFGKPSLETRTVENGEVTISSRCPEQVIGSCRASYRVTLPDNVPVEIETSSGAVRLSGVRASVRATTASGEISAAGFCGFALSATSDSGRVGAVAECSPDRLELRSRSGDVRAVVPAGRYQVDAQSGSGSVRLHGLERVENAPFQVVALSTSGDVTVEASS